VIIKVHENNEDNNGYNNEPLKHIGQQNKSAGDGQQQYPTDMQWG
jgi:hypothetical protein